MRLNREVKNFTPCRRLDYQAPVFFACLFMLATSAFFYNQALDSFFILDDHPNLEPLRFVKSFKDGIAYILEGPTGLRWLSYLTFLPHADAWRADNTFPFKVTNLLIHFLNSGLLLFFIYRLLMSRNFRVRQNHALCVSAFIATLWFAHPVNANIVLYSVQRMTLLAGSFTLLGLCYHFLFIERHQHEMPSTSAWLRYSAGLAFFTCIGVFSKESAALLPALVFLCVADSSTVLFRKWQSFILFVLPYIALLAYLVLANKLHYGGREFDIIERLLSEVVIVKQYLLKLLFPSPDSFALFYDGFKPVRSLTEPPFMLSACFWALLCFSALKLKSLSPVIFFGLAWFLAGHSLESSIIPLELYFDHRNYIPSIGVILVLVVTLYQLFDWLINEKKNILLIAVTICCALVIINMLWVLKLETSTWQNKQFFVENQIRKHPDSLRAKQSYVELLFEQGKYQQAAFILEKLHAQQGAQATHVIYQALALCYMGAGNNIKHTLIIKDLPHMPFDMSSDDAMHSFYLAAKRNYCPESISFEVARDYLKALLSNPKHRRHYHNYAFLIMHSYISEGRPDLALEASMLLGPELRSQQYWFTQLKLAIAVNDIKTAEGLYHEMQKYDSVKKLLYKSDLEEFSRQIKSLKQSRKTR